MRKKEIEEYELFKAKIKNYPNFVNLFTPFFHIYEDHKGDLFICDKYSTDLKATLELRDAYLKIFDKRYKSLAFKVRLEFENYSEFRAFIYFLACEFIQTPAGRESRLAKILEGSE